MFFYHQRRLRLINCAVLFNLMTFSDRGVSNTPDPQLIWGWGLESGLVWIGFCNLLNILPYSKPYNGQMLTLWNISLAKSGLDKMIQYAPVFIHWLLYAQVWFMMVAWWNDGGYGDKPAVHLLEARYFDVCALLLVIYSGVWYNSDDDFARSCNLVSIISNTFPMLVVVSLMNTPS